MNHFYYTKEVGIMKATQYRGLLGLVIFILAISYVEVKAQLVEGELMFVGYNADGDDGFSIVALVDIPANSTIYFTDNEWNGSAIGSGGAFNSSTEGEITWSTGASIIDEGTVITFDETNSTSNTNYGVSVGSISGSINLNASNEVLYMFLGTDDITPTTFLSAIANDGYNATKGHISGTGLSVGTDAISISGDEDVMVYTGGTTCAIPADCASAIATASNWATEDGGGDQSNNANTPNFPADVPASFGITPLPVELLYFKGITNASVVNLQWATASETINEYFEISRSTNGLDYMVIGHVEGNGTTSEVSQYTFEDSPDFNSSAYFYRLKQVDFDGTEEIVAYYRITVEKKTQIHRVFPNPGKDNLIYITDPELLNSVFLMDLKGKTLKHYQGYQIANGFEVGSCEPGIYIIKAILKTGKQQLIKFIKE